MDAKKRKALESKGWKIGDTKEFLNLSDEEVEYIELKIALSRSLRKQREVLEMTQKDLAKLSGSSQSRVAKMEAGDPSVSIDLLIKTLIAMGNTRDELAEMIGSDTFAAA